MQYVICTFLMKRCLIIWLHAYCAIVMAQNNSIAEFPRGLMQPEGSFRFSADALLLAAFTRVKKADVHLLDMGCGCGVIALSLLLKHSRLKALGVDCQPELLGAAEFNAGRLGLGGRFTGLCADVGKTETGIAPEGFDLVVCNPPYRQRGKGRLPRSPMRERALFEGPEGVAPFCLAAAKALRPGGRFSLIYPAERRHELFSCLGAAGFSLSRFMYIHSREGEEPGLVLVEAVRGGSLGTLPTELPGLCLHEGEGKNTKLTEKALEFCPELGQKKRIS